VFSRSAVTSTFRAEHGIPEGVPLVGIIAVLRSWKGHEDFLDAARIVRETNPNVRFVIVGEGPRAENIRNYIEQLGLSAAVTMTGHRKDVASVLAALDVFVLSSFGHEGVPQAVLQALAMEVPVVATDVGAVSEVVRDGETGLLARPRAPEDLAGHVLRLLQREDLRRVVTAGGRRLIEERYRLDLMLARIGALYEELSRRRGREVRGS
jgi:glycosyltransferase involved in cell wall biosynthesis